MNGTGFKSQSRMTHGLDKIVTSLHTNSLTIDFCTFCCIKMVCQNKVVLVFVTFVVALSSNAQASKALAIDPAVEAEIRALVETFLEENRAPGFSLGITGFNQTSQEGYTFSDGFGWENILKETFATETTLFFIGSISKSFTATVVLKQLYESFPSMWPSVLDTPISTLVPSYEFMMSDRYRTEKTSFRDLLSHRTCFITEPFSLNVVAYNASEYYYRQRYAPAECTFRNGFVYNNALYALVGDIIAEVAGIPFTQLLDNLFLALGMNDTTYVKLTDEHDVTNRATPYYIYNDEFQVYNYELLKRVTPAIGSGGIMSSAKDMLRYMQFHINEGSLEGMEIIPKEVWSAFMQPSNIIPSANNIVDENSNFFYTLAFDLGLYHGYATLAHSGYIPPFSSYLTLIPALRVGIFTSASGPGRHNHDIHEKIASVLTGLDMQGSFSKQQGRDSSLSTMASRTTQAHKLDSVMKQENPEVYLGHYGNPLSGEMDIIIKQHPTVPEVELYMSYGLWGKAWLFPFVNDTNSVTFLTEWDPEFEDVLQDAIIEIGVPDYSIMLTFYMDDNSQVELIALTAGDLGNLDFYKGLSIDLLPRQPWEDGSCK